LPGNIQHFVASIRTPPANSRKEQVIHMSAQYSLCLKWLCDPDSYVILSIGHASRQRSTAEVEGSLSAGLSVAI
jgi:hypothetical protein